MQRIHCLGAASLAAIMAAHRRADSRPPPTTFVVTDGNCERNQRANIERPPNLCGVKAKDDIMRNGRRNFMVISGAGILAWPLLARPVFAQAASATRIHGTITGLAGGKIAVRTTGGEAVAIAFDAKTPVTAVGAATLADIKPGSFVGTAARTRPDGTMVALEVHIFPESLRGTGEGHRPMEQQDTTMTNGTVGADAANVSSVSGRTLTLKYAGGEKTVLVPPGTPIVTFEVGTQAMLTPGAHVSISATEAAGGDLSAVRITVGKPGVTPPL